MINIFKNNYFVKCRVLGSLHSNEGTKIVYFPLKCKASELEGSIKTELNKNALDLDEIIFLTRV